MLLDPHTHITGKRQLEHVLAHIRAYGGGRSVVLPIEPGDCTGVGRERGWRTEAVIAAFERQPDEIIPFCHVNPFAADALEQIRRYYAMGIFRGFGEHKVKIACDHPLSMQIYHLCGELGWPVLMHFDYQDYHNYNIEAFAAVLEACPQTRFIGHAQSWWANISAAPVRDPRAAEFEEYPRGPVVPGGLVDRWLEEYPNLYADLSARSGYFALDRDPQFGRDFISRHRTKLMWATDCPCLDGKGDLGGGRRRDCLAALSLSWLRRYCESDEHFDDLTYRNAERLLGL